MKIRQNVVVFFILVIPWVTCAKLVSLKLTATGCEHNCINNQYADNSTCSASILINGRERSKKGDGFNVAVIDNQSGAITTAFFRWSSTSSASYSYAEKKAFHNFFKRIRSRAIIVIVFQNMCSYFEKDWYRFMYDYNIKLSKPSYNHYLIATVVACKGTCPQSAKGSLALPYSSIDLESRHRMNTDITFKLGTSASNFRNDGETNDDKGRAVSIVMVAAPVGGVVGCAIAFLICVFLYKRAWRHNENKHNKNLYPDRHYVPENGECGGGSSCTEPLYEELDNITRVEEKSNIYVDTNDLKHHVNGGPTVQNGDAVPLTPNQPSAPPLYLYHDDT